MHKNEIFARFLDSFNANIDGLLCQEIRKYIRKPFSFFYKLRFLMTVSEI